MSKLYFTNREYCNIFFCVLDRYLVFLESMSKSIKPHVIARSFVFGCEP